MRIVFRVFLVVLLFIILTVITQVGGIIYLFSFLIDFIIDRRVPNRLFRFGTKAISFILLYAFCVFLVVPTLARSYGRVQLPVLEMNSVQPLSIWTCIFNRNYVTPELYNTTMRVAGDINRNHPGTVINYLDANFPFISKFPLLPHLSHNDGKKLDIAFLYTDRASGQPTNETPSAIGYGAFEKPRANEFNQALTCAQKGFWQYTFMQKVASETKMNELAMDENRTKALANFFASESAIQKIFIEPHLKTRLGLTSGKFRFHGCQSVSHADHIHVQVK